MQEMKVLAKEWHCHVKDWQLLENPLNPTSLKVSFYHAE